MSICKTVHKNFEPAQIELIKGNIRFTREFGDLIPVPSDFDDFSVTVGGLSLSNRVQP